MNDVFSLFHTLAERGHALAQWSVGFMYQEGKGIPQDDFQAVIWYRRAAEQGLALAQSQLGLMYTHGRGVVADDFEALFWYQKAADQGHAQALQCLSYAQAIAH